MTQLFAKSGSRDGKRITLREHTQDVLRAVDALFVEQGGPSPLALAWLRFFSIPINTFDAFLRHLRVAAAAHDLGKANDGFLAAVNPTGSGARQLVRHEHLSGLLIGSPGIRSVLEARGLDPWVILGAVISHHLKVSQNVPEIAFCARMESEGRTVRLRVDCAEFRVLWEDLGREVGEPCPPPEVPTRLHFEVDAVPESVKTLRNELFRHGSRLRQDPARRHLLRAVRSALIAADALGSASVRFQGADWIERWVREVMPPRLTGNDVRKEIIDRRIAQLDSGKRWRGFDPFQREITTKGPRVLMTAPCGAGKTLAAWNWIAAQLDARPVSRAIFLYPTRATATEGFRDYVSLAPEQVAAIAHGSAAYELERMFDNPEDDREGTAYRVDPRLYALGFWGRSVFAATADQFLAFLQYSYGAMCLLPVLADSVLVIDEVHSYDRAMFTALRRFLVEFPAIPVLCMTATLPRERERELIETCGLVPYTKADSAGERASEDPPRYRIEMAARDEAIEAVRVFMQEHPRGRVLWVSNRVAVCQERAAGFQARMPDIEVECYHSRFTLRDRQERHKRVVERFQTTGSAGIVAFTTQVCEMSLDLDADLLITELAPISALIQRMGRCNRTTPIPPGRIGRVMVIEPDGNITAPYLGKEFEAELAAARRFVAALAGQCVSQTTLAEVYRKHDPGQKEPEGSCSFLDSGLFASSTDESFRDIEDLARPCVLARDVEAVLARIGSRSPWDGYVLPVPHKLLREAGGALDRPDRLPSWVAIAPDPPYHAFYGYRDLNHHPDRS